MRKYINLLFVTVLLRIILSVIFSPMGGALGVLVESGILMLLLIVCAFICHKLRAVTVDGQIPTLPQQFCSTVTFSGLLLLSYPVGYLVSASLPTLTYKTNLFVRLEHSYGLIYLCIPLSITLLFISVASVKVFSAQLKLKPILLSGLIFALAGMSVQGFVFDFIFGCFIYTFLIRYGSVSVCGVYIFLYKALWIVLEFAKHSFIGDATTSVIAELPYFLGTFMLFGSVLLLGIYLDLRFFEFKRKMPLFTAFMLPATVLMGVIGYFILNYITK